VPAELAFAIFSDTPLTFDPRANVTGTAPANLAVKEVSILPAAGLAAVEVVNGGTAIRVTPSGANAAGTLTFSYTLAVTSPPSTVTGTARVAIGAALCGGQGGGRSACRLWGRPQKLLGSAPSRPNLPTHPARSQTPGPAHAQCGRPVHKHHNWQEPGARAAARRLLHRPQRRRAPL
jgi:hypothetical protein